MGSAANMNNTNNFFPEETLNQAQRETNARLEREKKAREERDRVEVERFKKRWEQCIKVTGGDRDKAIELMLDVSANIETPKRSFEIQDTDWLRTAEIPPYGWIADELIPAQGITTLSAKTGEGKTFLTLYMLLRISEGKSVFGLTTKKTNCLLVEEEDDIRLTKERVALLGEGHFHFASWQGFNLENEADINAMVDICKERKIGLLVLDTYARIHSKEETNEANRENYKALTTIMKRAGVAILLIHHNRKDIKGMNKNSIDSLRGASDIGGMSEAVLIIETKKGQTDRQPENITKLHRAKMRASQNTQSIEIRWGERNGQMEFSHSLVEEKISRAMEHAEELKRFFEESGSGTYDDIELVTGLNRSQIVRAMKILQDIGVDIQEEKLEKGKKVFKMGQKLDEEPL